MMESHEVWMDTTELEKHKFRLRVLQGLGYLSLFLSFPMLIWAGMGFNGSLWAYSLLIFAIASPFFPFVLPIIAMRSLNKGKVVKAYFIMAIPFGLFVAWCLAFASANFKWVTSP